MTGYHVSIGYNGATRTDYDNMWEALKASARNVADDPQRIVKEARRLGSPENCSKGCCPLDAYADNYALPFSSPGHPVNVLEDGEAKQIMQLASTGDEIKYHVRRAYIRLLIEEMHRQEIEVNLIVG